MTQITGVSVAWILFYFQVFMNINAGELAVSTCNGKLRGSSGTFTSPNYPHPPNPPRKMATSFPDNRGLVTCQWEIEVPPGKGIQIKFGDFDMEAPLDDCDSGEVEVYSGMQKKKSSLDKYCPGNAPDTVTLLNDTATVVFRRPSSFSGRGFLISYIAINPGKPIDDFVTCSKTGRVYIDAASFSVMCPSGCGNILWHGIWGSLPYRDNSHLCRAAIHAGVISDEFGGSVRVERKSGNVLYYGSVANNISAKIGALSDFLLDFPDLKTCHQDIDLREDQFSASSYWNTTDEDGRVQTWIPGKATLTGLSEAWSPDDCTKEQWLQVDLGGVMNVTAIITKGSSRPYSYTKSFTIKYSVNNIVWHSYREGRHRQTKVFTGNTNYFAKVRNNFIRPSLVARHIRVYPIMVPTRGSQHLRYSLKLGLQGCKISAPVLVPIPGVQKPTIVSTTMRSPNPASSTSLPVSKPTVGKVNYIGSTSAGHTNTFTYSTTNASLLLPNADQPIDPVKTDPDDIGSDNLNDKSILIVAIVSAMAVTSILLAALVLVLVRKRKGKTKRNTNIPSQALRTDAALNGGREIDRFSDGNKKKRNKTLMNESMQFKNEHCDDHFKNNRTPRPSSLTNSRGGVSIQHDHQQRRSLGNGDALTRSPSFLPSRVSLSGTSDLSGHMMLPNGNAHDFTTDDDYHEYQVILDPVDNHSTDRSSKASTGSFTGIRSKSVQVEHFHNEAGQCPVRSYYGKDPASEQPLLSSFAPQRQDSFGGGAYSHPTNTSIKKGKESPLIPPTRRRPPQSGYLTPSRLSFGEKSERDSPPHKFSSRNKTKHSSQRHSSSSGGSSSHPPFHPSTGLPYSHTSSHFGSDPEVPEMTTFNGNIVPPQTADPSNPSQLARKASYNVPNSMPAQPSLSTTLSPTKAGVYPGKDHGFKNGFGLWQSNPRTGSLNQAKTRNGYDHLCRSNSAVAYDKHKCVVDITMNDYNQLEFNKSV